MVIELSKTLLITYKVKRNRREEAEKGNCWEVTYLLVLTKMPQSNEPTLLPSICHSQESDLGRRKTPNWTCRVCGDQKG